MLTKLFPDRGSYTLSPPPTPHTSAQTYDVLNELVLDRGPNAFLTNIEVWEKGRFITRVQADGIMLSTPTGGRGVRVGRRCGIRSTSSHACRLMASCSQHPLVGVGT